MTPFVEPNGTISQIVVNSIFPGLDGYAIVVKKDALSSQVLRLANGSVLANRGAWEYISALNDEMYRDVAVDWTVSPEIVYLASDSNVLVSQDEGATWQRCVGGFAKPPPLLRATFRPVIFRFFFWETPLSAYVWTVRLDRTHQRRWGNGGGGGGGGGEGGGGGYNPQGPPHRLPTKQ